MKTFTNYALPALLLLTVVACIKEPDFSDVPSITALPFEHRILSSPDRLGNRVLRDSVVFQIGFQDGDGDLGITSDEYAGKGDPKLKGLNNYVVRVFRKVGSTYKEVFPQVSYTSYFPPLKPDGKKGPIEGTLRFSQTFYQDFTQPLRKDTLKFQIKIIDRALHESNPVETDTIMVYPPVYK
jgi:hypothetical protein